MKFFWSRFRNNRFFLPGYLLAHALGLAIALAAFRHFGVGIHVAPSPVWLCLIIPASVYYGLRITTVMHNCMHDNLRWGNILVGEIGAAYITMSFGIVSILHVMHHAHPDTDRDPHNPAGMTFWQYFLLSQFRGVGGIGREYYTAHGDTAANRRLYAGAVALHFLGNVLRPLLFVQLLGPVTVPVWISGFVAYLFVFAHNGYTTHGQDENGKSVVRNIDSNLYYKAINRICDGIYFHKEHHRFPRRYNPKVAG